eukprot:6188953-Pleurochrysis_carterae.AAC.5
MDPLAVGCAAQRRQSCLAVAAYSLPVWTLQDATCKAASTPTETASLDMNLPSNLRPSVHLHAALDCPKIETASLPAAMRLR